jgi:2-keto-4-pentenoate hydratase/2-oxohepta-3-ene-1,7-dioic acid hydratase in catechol pathway
MLSIDKLTFVHVMSRRAMSSLVADSRFVTMEPGDLIFTGTPSGVGCFRSPQVWLKAGDVVECEIEGIGVISNPIV